MFAGALRVAFHPHRYWYESHATAQGILATVVILIRSKTRVASDRQIAANKANAVLSTGPRTKAGKDVSRRNALRHGITAKSMLLHGEDPHHFEALRQDLVKEFQPTGPSQEYLADSIAMLLWRLRRVPAFEAAVLEWTTFDRRDYRRRVEEPAWKEDAPSQHVVHQRILGRALEAAMSDGDLFSKLSRYESRLFRELERTLNLLRKAQAERLHVPSDSQ